MIRVSTQSLIPGSVVVSRFYGLGVPVPQIPSTGDAGPAFLYNDIADLGAGATDELRASMLTLPAAGTMDINENSSFAFTGAPDGTNTATYTGFINGAPYDADPDNTNTITLIIGGGGTPVDQDIAVGPVSQLVQVNTPAIPAALVVTADGVTQSGQVATPAIVADVAPVVVPLATRAEVAPSTVAAHAVVVCGPAAQLTNGKANEDFPTIAIDPSLVRFILRTNRITLR